MCITESMWGTEDVVVGNKDVFIPELPAGVDEQISFVFPDGTGVILDYCMDRLIERWEFQ